MRDLLSSLARRAVQPRRTAQPRPHSLFEPLGPAALGGAGMRSLDGLEEESHEEVSTDLAPQSQPSLSPVESRKPVAPAPLPQTDGSAPSVADLPAAAAPRRQTPARPEAAQVLDALLSGSRAKSPSLNGGLRQTSEARWPDSVGAQPVSQRGQVPSAQLLNPRNIPSRAERIDNHTPERVRQASPSGGRRELQRLPAAEPRPAPGPVGKSPVTEPAQQHQGPVPRIVRAPHVQPALAAIADLSPFRAAARKDSRHAAVNGAGSASSSQSRPEETIHVSIGRIEVRATSAAPPRQQPSAKARVGAEMSLNDYLDGRTARGPR